MIKKFLGFQSNWMFGYKKKFIEKNLPFLYFKLIIIYNYKKKNLHTIQKRAPIARPEYCSIVDKTLNIRHIKTTKKLFKKN